MRWGANVIKEATTGSHLNGLFQSLKKWLTSNKLTKWFSKILMGIRSLMNRNLEALQLKSCYNRSNEITVNQLIQLLDGNIYAVKRRWYARKSWVQKIANELQEESFQYLNRDDFDKHSLAYQKVIEKKAIIQHLQTEFYILKIKIENGYKDIENCSTFQRYSLDWREQQFVQKFAKLVNKMESEMIKYMEFLKPKNAEKEVSNISFEDTITEQIIIINGGMIDKNSITAKDFYIMLIDFKRKNTPKNGK